MLVLFAEPAACAAQLATTISFVCACDHGIEQHTTPHQCHAKLFGNHSSISNVAWVEGSNTIAALGGHLSVWDAATRAQIASFECVVQWLLLFAWGAHTHTHTHTNTHTHTHTHKHTVVHSPRCTSPFHPPPIALSRFAGTPLFRVRTPTLLWPSYP